MLDLSSSYGRSGDASYQLSFRKPRQHVNSGLLLELLTGVYMALYNGSPDLALHAIEAMHQRAQYEILAEVILARFLVLFPDPITLNIYVSLLPHKF